MTAPNTLKIALGFSGGGYRAGAFNRGVLSFLGQVDTAGGALLGRVEVLSKVAGGTVTGSGNAIWNPIICAGPIAMPCGALNCSPQPVQFY